jgi:hypothetical protein
MMISDWPHTYVSSSPNRRPTFSATAAAGEVARYAHRPAAGSATPRGTRRRISGRWSADCRWFDRGSDAACGRRRGGFCAAGDPWQGPGGLAYALARAVFWDWVEITKLASISGRRRDYPRVSNCVHRGQAAVPGVAPSPLGAAVAMRVEDYCPKGKHWWIRLHEKGGERPKMPAS